MSYLGAFSIKCHLPYWKRALPKVGLCPSRGHLDFGELIPVVCRLSCRGFKCKHRRRSISHRVISLWSSWTPALLPSFDLQDQAMDGCFSPSLASLFCLIIGYIVIFGYSVIFLDSVLLVIWLGRMVVTFTSEFNWELLFSLLVGAGLYLIYF